MSANGSPLPVDVFTSGSYQDRYIRLLREITGLQWVRESLPVQTRYYEGLKQRLKREQHLKTLLENQVSKKQDTQLSLLQRNSRRNSNGLTSPREQPETSNTGARSSLQSHDTEIKELESQLKSVERMMNDLSMDRRRLDTLCEEMHKLYEEIVSDEAENDPAYVMERRLRADVIHLADEIPKIEREIKSYSKAQKKLYEARDRMEEAMMSLPGASTFLDRQAITRSGKPNNALSALLDASLPSMKEAERLAQLAYQLEAQASELCVAVPLIPTTAVGRDDHVTTVLTSYRGYRLKLETSLRTCVNPRLNKLQSELAISKYHYEQKNLDWIDQQIVTLENVLRRNGCLTDENLEREISVLRMGSRAAIAAAGAETSGRVTVDDVLDVSPATLETGENGQLPEYSESIPQRLSGAPLPVYHHSGGEDPPAYS